MHLERKQRDVGIEEEIQVRVLDTECPRRSATFERDPRSMNPASPIGADAPFAPPPRPLLSRAGPVQEALRVRQEGDEFAVVTLLEGLWILAELVDDFRPPAVGRRVQ